LYQAPEDTEAKERIPRSGAKENIPASSFETSRRPPLSSVAKEHIPDTSVETSKRPPLSALIGDKRANITGDVQFLLDFAIVGHPKTGTDSQMRWIAAHDEIQMYAHEVRSLKDGKPAELVSLLYNLPEGSQFKRGYKAPNDIRLQSSLKALHTYWPKTKLIVGVRHPVKWFESYYNYRIRMGSDLPPAETLVGPKLPDQVRYHNHLAMLGKTNPMDDSKQLKLLRLDSPPLVMSNKVFLYDKTQPFDTNETRAETYRRDLSNFIGVSKPLVLPKNRVSHNKGYAINICDDKFITLRAELLENGRAASKWIQTYFMDHPDVTVSSPNYFKEILQTWSEDPCDQQ
jgi:hypothetical protein